MTGITPRATLAAVLTLSAAPLVAQQDVSQATVTLTHVAGSVHMIVGAGGNIGLSIGEDDAFVVDDQYAPLTAKIRAAIATVTPKPVRFVLNTHWHGDHTGGNEQLAAAGAMIVAHRNVRTRMSAEQFLEAFDWRTPPSPRGALPVITFSDTITFYLNGDTVRAIHMPQGHTDGDAMIHFRAANVVHMGDLFFNGGYPFIDLSTGGSLDGTIDAVEEALGLSNASTKFIPGHGPLATRADLVRYRDMLTTVRTRVSRLVAQKRTLAQIRAAKPLADLDATWGSGFMKPDVFLGIAYASLTKRAAGGRR